jgi:translation initiation factor 2D
MYKVGGRRGRTEITGFEPFLVIDGEEMADRMRKICAGSTSSKFVASEIACDRVD